MGSPAENIRVAVREERFVFGAHADERIRQRSIVAWQIIAGMEEAKLIHERPDNLPNPVAEFELLLTDGTSCKAVWAWISADRIAKLVTVHFLDR